MNAPPGKRILYLTLLIRTNVSSIKKTPGWLTGWYVQAKTDKEVEQGAWDQLRRKKQPLKEK